MNEKETILQGNPPSMAIIQAFFDEPTNTVSYLVIDAVTRQAAIIDPVLDYDHSSGRYSTHSADAMIAATRSAGAIMAYVLETHVHADHMSGGSHIRRITGARIGIGEHIRSVQQVFQPMFDLDDISGEGDEFDILCRDGQSLPLGSLAIKVLHTPGHTPACVSYHIGDAVFVGDTIFMPDYGTARTDFPGGCAQTLFRSIRRILSLPPRTRLFMCHDYKTAGRNHYAWETTVAEQAAGNVHARAGTSELEFVRIRQQRDARLPAPKLLLPSIQVNIRAGELPPAHANGVRYLKIPLLPMPEKMPADTGGPAF